MPRKPAVCAIERNEMKVDVGAANTMIGCEYVVTMAAYNEWMNAKLYETAGGLSAGELAVDRRAKDASERSTNRECSMR